MFFFQKKNLYQHLEKSDTTLSSPTAPKQWAYNQWPGHIWPLDQMGSEVSQSFIYNMGQTDIKTIVYK